MNRIFAVELLVAFFSCNFEFIAYMASVSIDASFGATTDGICGDRLSSMRG